MARVAVDLPLPHLDRPFDYLVPAPLATAARPGVRVRVRFAGQDVDGWLLERVETSSHPGRLAPLRRVVSPEPVLTPAVAALARAVADRYAGSLVDVLRLAVPARHARTEKEAPATGPAETGPGSEPGSEPGPGQTRDEAAAIGPWRDYPAGQAFVSRLAAGGSPRAVWTALPGPTWATALAVLAAATLRSGRGSVLVVPDRRDLERLEAALLAVLGPERHARLEADLGPEQRYRAFLRLSRGQVRVAIGTRASVFAPVENLGLVAVWDDGDPQHAEPRAPYPHVREVAQLRAEQAGAAVLIGGWSRSVEAAALVESGWARPIEVERAVVRRVWPRVRVAADGHPEEDPRARAARMPPVAWRAVQTGLTRGPVLVQVARSGYVAGTACQTCRGPARCPQCRGPVILLPAAGGARPTAACGWCGTGLPAWSCPVCGGRRLRARAIGVERTAEELGRAFPGAQVVVSRADRVLPEVPDGRAVVLATAGIEPVSPSGYAAAVLLDGDVLLERPDLRAGEEALRRWRAAAALVRPAADGGAVVVCADPTAVAVQALVRGDPAGFARRELAERSELGLPPAATAATVTGSAAAVRAVLDAVRLPDRARVLGPVPVETRPVETGPGETRPGAAVRAEAAEPVVRAVVQVPSAQALALALALHQAAAVCSARRLPNPPRIQVDPRDLG